MEMAVNHGCRNTYASPASTVLIKWTPPNIGAWKLNTNGACTGSSNRVAGGGIIRDQDGSWLHSFASNLGFCDSSTAELWAVWLGPHFTWDKGCRNLLLEVDSLEVHRMLNAKVQLLNHQPNLCFEYRDLLKRDWSISVRHVFREANRRVDRLGSIGLNLLEDFREFSGPPGNILKLIEDDRLGVPIPRNIVM